MSVLIFDARRARRSLSPKPSFEKPGKLLEGEEQERPILGRHGFGAAAARPGRVLLGSYLVVALLLAATFDMLPTCRKCSMCRCRPDCRLHLSIIDLHEAKATRGIFQVEKFRLEVCFWEAYRSFHLSERRTCGGWIHETRISCLSTVRLLGGANTPTNTLSVSPTIFP